MDGQDQDSDNTNDSLDNDEGTDNFNESHDDSAADSDTGSEEQRNDESPDVGDEGVETDGSGKADPSATNKPEVKGPERRLNAVLNLFKSKNKENKNKPESEKAEPAAAGDKQPANKEDGKPGAKPDELTDELKKHPAVARLMTENQQMRGSAGRWNELQGFMKETGIGADDAKQGWEMMALSKTNPQEFLARARKIVKEYEIALGESFEDDIQKALDDGEISDERAKELQKARVENRALQGRTKQQGERIAANEAAVTEQQREQIIGGFLTQVAKTNPSVYSDTMLSSLEGEMLRLQKRHGPPEDQQQVYNLIDAAYNNVMARTRNPGAGKKPTPKTPKNSGRAPGGKPGEPPAGADFNSRTQHNIRSILNKRKQG